MSTFNQQFRAFVESINPKSCLRMAPTPSGYLHMGNAFNFALNWLAARGRGGTLLLRIDDLDADRKRPEYVQDIWDTLAWLELDYDREPVFQSDHSRLPLYHDALRRLREKELLFACRKSRKELEPYGGRYPEVFRQQGLDLDEPDVAWRVKTPPGFPIPDFVVRRRDGIPAYQIASLADDLDLGITHLIRGADLEASSMAQQYLASCLGEQAFSRIQFLHHPLLLDEDGGKLSKSAGSASLRHLRESQFSPQDLFAKLGVWLQVEANSAASLLQALNS
ncbi:MAG TPA: glutamate--tRNA ligase family protein [Saprospiraceae bacterium]|nr:glutamate--tRNA ligase family protein [Saprospiraceae bacterium]